MTDPRGPGRSIALVPDEPAPPDCPATWYSGFPLIEEQLESVGFFVPPYMGAQKTLRPMRQVPNLQICQLLTIGFDGALAVLPDGAVLCNAAGVREAGTAELALGLIVASLRGIDEAARAVPTGIWTHSRREARADKTVLIIGAGGVSRALERRLAGFEITVAMIGRTARDGVISVKRLGDLLPNVDVVVLAVPMTGETAGMVNAAFIARMKDGALLVNVSRGGVVDTQALLAETRKVRLRAALDVTDPEPLPPEHELWRSRGVLMTPHVGGNASTFLPRARRLVAAQIERWRSGEPLANVAAGG